MYRVPVEKPYFYVATKVTQELREIKLNIQVTVLKDSLPLGFN